MRIEKRAVRSGVLQGFIRRPPRICTPAGASAFRKSPAAGRDASEATRARPKSPELRFISLENAHVHFSFKKKPFVKCCKLFKRVPIFPNFLFSPARTARPRGRPRAGWLTAARGPGGTEPRAPRSEDRCAAVARSSVLASVEACIDSFVRFSTQVYLES